ESFSVSLFARPVRKKNTGMSARVAELMVLSKKYFESGDLVSSEKYFSQARRLFPGLRRPNWLSNQSSEPLIVLESENAAVKSESQRNLPEEKTDSQKKSGFFWNFVLLVILIVAFPVFCRQLWLLYNILRQKTPL
ncbi:MAG: hypothetical protein AB1403_13740, partial [Candidatus Riflebacteria bacterium]